MISILDKADLYLTYSWNEYQDHGICGHLFEVIDYYLLLKRFFSTRIVLAELNEDILKSAILNKYDLSDEELNDLLNNTEFISKKTKLVKVKNILFTDGGIDSISKLNILAENIFMFACGSFNLQKHNNPKYKVLQDFRIYGEDTLNSIHYIKKILFNKLKNINNSSDNYMVYTTSNCRAVSIDYLISLIEKYNISNLLVISNIEYSHPKITSIKPPIDDLFSQFGTYIYTPVPRQFDCSPRFIAECHYYNKEVIFEIDYLEKDLGLYYRVQDIKHNFSSLFLDNNDDIIKILKQYV